MVWKLKKRNYLNVIEMDCGILWDLYFDKA